MAEEMCLGSVELAADPELAGVARRLFWWESPEQSLADPLRFSAQVMAIGTWNDIRVVQAKLGESAFARVSDKATPGLFTARRWNYWHVRFQRFPVPPLPRRFPK